MSDQEPTSFEEFWPYYVSQHRDPTCRRLHFVGTSLAMGCVAVAPMYPPALLAAPVFGYGFAWVGHFAFEHNKPASWASLKAAAWSLRGDFRMWRRMIQGTMDAELARPDAQAHTNGYVQTGNGVQSSNAGPSAQ